MPVVNFLNTPYVEEICHDGEGLVKIANLFDSDFKTPLQFMHYTVLPARASIGAHTHGDDEEVYVVLEGNGIMDVDGEKVSVKKGDVILNRPFGTHSLLNTSDTDDLKILVFEVSNTI